MFNKKGFIQQKLEGGCLILRNILLCATYSIFCTAPGTLFHLMSVDIGSLTALIILFLTSGTFHVNCFDRVRVFTGSGLITESDRIGPEIGLFLCLTEFFSLQE